MKNSILILAVSVFASAVFSQISGNQIYGNQANNYYHQQQQYSNQMSNQKRNIITTDSTITITTNILMNKEADWYQLTVGTNQEGSTVKLCNQNINERINAFTKALSVFGVSKDDFYVDFISQTKVYDYELADRQAEQFEVGFEIKKNIIIKLKDIDAIDQIIEMAAAQEIYDIIKVEYIDGDIDKTYNFLYQEALSLIDKRLKLYGEFAAFEPSKKSSTITDNFYSMAPKNQYKRYEAFESSKLNVYQHHNYAQRFVQKEMRKQSTYYYDGMPFAGFDKVINSDQTKIGLQYVLTVTVTYKRPK